VGLRVGLGLGFALLAASAHADFIITPPMMRSVGALGNAGNSVATYTYAGPDTIVVGGEFTGAISAVIRGTLMGEARWSFRNTRFGTAAQVSFQPAPFGYFEGSVLIAANPGGGMILRDGDALRLETFESFDDGAGEDAIWSDVSWTFVTATPIDLGTRESLSSIRTSGGDGFGTDTEIALFDDAGTLLAWNDDFGGTSGSGFVGLSLADGDYVLAVLPYDAAGTNGLVRPGFAGTGDYALAMDGVEVDAGTLGAYETVWYTFRVGVACPVDFNNDGFVDFFDYDEFVTAFEAGDPAADFNGDGFLDFFDYDDFVAGFEAGC
jgi:hypothetical protein